MSDELIKDFFERSEKVLKKISEDCFNDIKKLVEIVVNALENDNKILLCGNGGSAADCQHIATELVIQLSHDFKRKAFPAIALTTNTSTLTAAGNDLGFESVFSRQVEAFGRKGDILIAISTSGNSQNVIEAVKEAKSAGMITVGFLGGTGGKLIDLVDHSIVIPDENTMYIQQGHEALGHLMCYLVEREMKR
ncbi:SIS domain-containing protein [candidate division KSB1 bacterium]